MDKLGRVSRRWQFGWVAAIPLALAACSTTPSSTPSTPSTAAAAGNAVIAVKIDNVAGARPATGLGSAEAIYVIPVEGGLTRIIAVFGADRPDVVGPVRSARQTDLNLLAQFGRPTFAYSGSVPQLVSVLRDSPFIRNAAQAYVPNAYLRRSTHPAPHNLYVRPALLPAGNPPPGDVFAFGPPPAGGTPTTDHRVAYPAASFEFRWSAGRWLAWMDGTPYQSSESGQLGAASVVVQHVTTTPEAFPEDASGAVAPVAQTIGTGTATVLRDGQSYPATWSRPTAADPTRYTVAGSGTPLPLATGPIWVLLVAV